MPYFRTEGWVARIFISLPIHHQLMITQVRGIFSISGCSMLADKFCSRSLKVDQPLSIEIKISKPIAAVHRNVMLKDVSKTVIASIPQCVSNFHVHVDHLGTLLK